MMAKRVSGRRHVLFATVNDVMLRCRSSVRSLRVSSDGQISNIKYLKFHNLPKHEIIIIPNS